MKRALSLVEGWCHKENQRVYPSKTALIPFTRKKIDPNLSDIKFSGRHILS